MTATLEQIKSLRESTGLSIMSCKKALSETNGDLEKALELLRKKGETKAQKVAERFGLNQLAIKISSEHKNLLEHVSTWEDLKDTEISLAERIKLAGLNKHMKEILQKSTIITAQITEEKVSIHRERKVCLICKGEVLGYIYVCNCDAIYCESCSRALTDLENVCWACDMPIDYSKPVKPPVVEEKVEIEEKIKKK